MVFSVTCKTPTFPERPPIERETAKLAKQRTARTTGSAPFLLDDAPGHVALEPSDSAPEYRSVFPALTSAQHPVPGYETPRSKLAKLTPFRCA